VHESGLPACLLYGRFRAGCVAKLFSRPERAILIQGRAQARNVDSKTPFSWILIIARSQHSKEFCNTFVRKADLRLRALPEPHDVVSRGPVDNADDVARDRVDGASVFISIRVPVVNCGDRIVGVSQQSAHCQSAEAKPRHHRSI
jgi:hypothetical protein